MEIEALKNDVTHFGDSVEPRIEKVSTKQSEIVIVNDMRNIRKQLNEKKIEIARKTENRYIYL